MKTGIIDVGGGFRDIYGAGILDVCMERGIEFDYCIGISAGSANLASFLARQHGRNYTFYMEYVFRKEYASPENWLRTRNYVDLDYVYDALSGSKGKTPSTMTRWRATRRSSASARATRAPAGPSISPSVTTCAGTATTPSRRPARCPCSASRIW